MAEQTSQRMPRGVIAIATLLIIGAFFTGGLGSLVPTSTLDEAGLPRSLLLTGALLTTVLAYGLLRMRRWAWGATLSFVIVQAVFVVLNTLVYGTAAYAGLAILLAIAAYMLQPSVRSAFFRRSAHQ
ncbi:MAG: hypothetical protein JOZ51_05950 [Chloroflexi bacterium]|nr:hypothetical protein [Chloroflexota bacterium]